MVKLVTKASVKQGVKPSAKSSEAFRTIGEVSDELAVPKHVLRFWEGKFPQLKPMKRGGGRRFYRPEDVILLRGIKQLLHAAGYTIKGVQRILREDGVEAVKTLAASGNPPALGQRAPGKPAKKGEPATPKSGKTTLETAVASNETMMSASLQKNLRGLATELENCLALAKGQLTTKPALERKPNQRSKRG